MKKLMKYALAFGLGLSTIGAIAFNDDVTAEASSIVVKKEFPKSFQRTWYAYDKAEGTYDKVTFYKGGKMSSRECYEGKCTSSKPSRVKIYYFADPKKPLWNVKGLYQTAGAGMYYNVGTRTINGKKYKVLKEYSGAGAWFDRYYYTKKIKK